MNYSVAIDNPKYDRNSLLFSLGFILAEGIDTEPFEPILRKLSAAFLALEVGANHLLFLKLMLHPLISLSSSHFWLLENNPDSFLSPCHCFSLQNESEFLFLETTKPQIQDVLKRLYEDLTTKGETFIYLNESNVLTAKIFESPKEPIDIFDYNVPVLRYGRISQLNIPWDISLNYLLNRIDGISHIKKIASRKPPIDIECVKRCLRTLLFYDCVIISDVIQLSNVYQLTPAVHSIISDNSTMLDIQGFSCVDPDAPPSLHNIIKFLLKFRPGKQLSHILLSGGADLVIGIDIRRLIAIAQNYKVITRLHEYPMYIFKKQIHSHYLQTQQDDSNHSMDDVKHYIELDSNLKSGGITLLHPNHSSITPTQTSVSTHTGNMSFNPHQNTFKESNGVQSINPTKIKKINGRSNTMSSGHSETIIDATVPKDFSAILHTLKGTVCLDSICCDYEISPSEIFDSPKYYIVYK